MTWPSLLDDLDRLGPLRSSASDFVRMWERAAAQREGPAQATDDLDAQCIVVEPPHATRRDAYPSECDTAYCPAALIPGQPCRFNAESVSGTCEGAGACGTPTGLWSCARFQVHGVSGEPRTQVLLALLHQQTPFGLAFTSHQ